MKQNPSVFKIGQASRQLGVSIDTLRRWERSGKITPIRTPGGTRLYAVEELKSLTPTIEAAPTLKLLQKKAIAEQPQEDYQHFSHPIVLETIIKQKLDEQLGPVQDFADLGEPSSSHQKIYIGAVLSLILLLLGATFYAAKLPTTSNQQPVTSNDVLAASSIAEAGKFLEINADSVLTGNMAVNGESVFGEGVTAQSTLNVGGASTLSTTSVGSTLSVTGLSTLTGGLTTPGKITLTNNAAETLLIKPASDPSSSTKLFVIQNAAGTEKASIDSSGATILSSTLKVSGATTLSSTISVSGATTLSSSLEVSGTSTLSGAVVGSAAGSASTPGLKLTGAWYTGGSATTTKPQLLVEPTDTTSTGWSTSGTGIGVNAKSAFTGNLIDLQLAGTSKFKVDYAGNYTSTGVFLAADGTVSAPAYSFSADTDTGLYRSTSNTLDFSSGGVRTLTLATATSGVNYISITPAATGSGPTLASAGSDTNIPLTINSILTGALTLDSTSTGIVNLGTGNSGKTINVGTGTGADTINIGTGGTSADTITIGNNASTTGLTLTAGTGNIALTGAATTTYTIGETTTTGTITLGKSTAGQIINIGGAQVATGNTQTIHIGDSATGTGKDVITIGNTNGASSLALNTGTGGLTIASNGTSAWTNTAGNLTISTATSGTLALDSAGALNIGPTNATSLGIGRSGVTTTINGTLNTTSPQITTGITTDSTTFNLINTTATTLNIGGAATTALNIGNGSGTITNIGNSGGATAFNVTTGTGSQTFTSSVATGTTTTSGFVFTDSALTTGTLNYLTSSSITTGKLLDITTGSANTWTGNGTTNGLVNLASSSTAGTVSSSDILLNISRSGANANTAHTAYGLYSNVTNTNATSGTNVAGYFSASGATTNNYALYANAGSSYFATTQTVASAASATLDAFNIPASTITVSGTTNITTATGFNLVNLGQPTYSNASIAISNAATLYIANAPTASGGGSITNPYALWVDNGNTRLDGNLAIQGGTLDLSSGATNISIVDNTASAFTIKQGTNTYFDITTTDNSEAMTLNLPAGGGTSLTANLFTSNIAKTINLGTGTAADTINIGTGGTTADTITFGNTGVATSVNINSQPASSGLGSAALVVTNNQGNGSSSAVRANGPSSSTGDLAGNDPTYGWFGVRGAGNIPILGVASSITNFAGQFTGRVTVGGVNNYGGSPILTVESSAVTSLTAERILLYSTGPTLTLSDGTTITNQRTNQFLASTINGVAGGGTETVTNAATVYIDAAPSGSNITITNPYALWVDAGLSRLDDALSVNTAASPSYALDVGSSTSYARGINLAQSGAKTAADYGSYLANTSTSSTASINKYGEYITSTGTWNGTSAINYGLYIAAPTGGTSNYNFWANGGNVVLNGGGALATTATDGFTYLPTSAGAPTGTPTSVTGAVAFEYDTTNNKLCAYNTAWKCTAALADVAEWVPAAGAEAGDLVSITEKPNPTPDPTAPFMLGKSTKAYDGKLVGVISQYAEEANAANGYKLSDDYHAMTLVGRVPVKINTENGPIEKGDYLTSSSTPGVAMKATNPGPTIGKALEEYNGEGIGKILVFVNVGFADPKKALANLLLDEQGNLVIPKVKTASLQIGPIGQIGQISPIEKNNALDVASKLKVIDEAIATQSAQLAKATEELASASAKLAKLTPPEILLATGSATLANFKATETLSSEKLLTALDVTVSGIFKALGEAILPKTIIAGGVVVDGTLSIDNGSEINAIPTLYIQKNSLASSLDILNGKFIFNKEGKLAVAGTVEAEQFSVTSGKSAGVGKILTGQLEAIIENGFVKTDSIVILTPEVEISQTISVVQKTDGKSFKVKIANPETKDITFSYLIIGQNKSKLISDKLLNFDILPHFS